MKVKLPRKNEAIQRFAGNGPAIKLLLAAGLFLVMVLYASIYFRNTFPLSEGWNVNYAQLVLQGKLPYRDFYYYLPPLNILLDIVAWSLSFGSLFVYRLWWLLQRIVIFELIFFLLSRYFKPGVAFVACALSSVLSTASVYDLFGDYNQTPALLSVILVRFAIAFSDADTVWKKCKAMFGAGCMFALLLLNKQTIFVSSVIVYAAVLAVYCLLNRDKAIWKYILAVACGAIAVLLPVVLFMAFSGMLIPFVEQVFLYTGGKGSLFDIVVTRLVKKFPYIFCWLLVAAAFLAAYLGKKRGEKSHGQPGRMVLVCLAVLAAAVYSQEVDIVIQALGLTLRLQAVIMLAALPLVTVLVLHFTGRGPVWLRSQKAIFTAMAVWSFAALLGGYLIDSPTGTVMGALYSGGALFAAVTNGLYFICFYFMIVLMAKRLFFGRKGDKRNTALLWISCCGFALAYAAAMTSSAELPYYAMPVAVALVLCEVFSLDFADKLLENGLKGFAILVCTVLCFVCMSQKELCAYDWWGGDAAQPKNDKVYSTDIPALKGFTFSESLRDTYEGVTKLIEENSDPDDVIYGYPYVKIFNILTDRYAFETFVPVMFYDVSDDRYIQQENALLMENLPDILIWQDIPWCLEVHEEVFRDGKPLEQRNTIALFESVIPTRYQVLGVFGNLTVYRLIQN